jgi:hypothetical protein
MLYRLIPYYIFSCYISWTHNGVRCLESCSYMTWIVQSLRSALSKGLNRVGVSLASPEDRNRSSFQNVVF